MNRRRLEIALATAVAATLLAPSAGAWVRGLDVSHYNGSIQWQPVADAGYRFAFAEASKGNDGTDSRYATFRDDAASVGMWLGAYHFARPGGTTASTRRQDAIAEARHFAAVAQPAADDLVPVLDLERSGGLRPAALVAWASAWLRETERLVGARPAVYTSVAFWRHSLGDTTAFAKGGYLLWLARWTRGTRPELPALGWAGLGWTFWQWTSCGRVPGLRGCVDLDRFRGPDLTPYLVGSAPHSLVPPEVEGPPAQGQLLTATEGAWDGAGLLDYTYQWQRCDALGEACKPIPGAQASTYALTAEDVAHAVVAVVTASNHAGSATAPSLPTPAIAA